MKAKMKWTFLHTKFLIAPNIFSFIMLILFFLNIFRAAIITSVCIKNPPNQNQLIFFNIYAVEIDSGKLRGNTPRKNRLDYRK